MILADRGGETLINSVFVVLVGEDFSLNSENFVRREKLNSDDNVWHCSKKPLTSEEAVFGLDQGCFSIEFQF